MPESSVTEVTDRNDLDLRQRAQLLEIAIQEQVSLDKPYMPLLCKGPNQLFRAIPGPGALQTNRTEPKKMQSSFIYNVDFHVWNLCGTFGIVFL